MTTRVRKAPLFLSVEETAEKLHMSTKRLGELRRAEKGPKFVKISPKTILYFRVDVQAWKRRNETARAA